MGDIRVAIVGVGNCASALYQGLYFYKSDRCDKPIPGLMHKVLGGYSIADIQIVAAFDVDIEKVGERLGTAITKGQNNTIQFNYLAGHGPIVHRGRTLDGLGTSLSKVIEKAPGPSADVVGILRQMEVDVVVNLLPVGSEEATKYYADCAIQAGCAFVNGIPVFIASDKTGYWPEKFHQAGLPVLGDDVKSQVGATIIHRVLTDLFEKRGVRLDRTYQLNFGGNTDFLNMLDRERLESKKISKTGSVQSQLAEPLGAKDIHVGPSDHVPWLEDRKWCYIRMEGTTFGEVPLNVEVKLEVWDSPNSAGVLVDAIRYAKIALDRGEAGPIAEPSSYLFKTPPVQYTDDEARFHAEVWASGYDF